MCRSEALSVNSEFQSGFCETLKNTVFEQLSLIHHQLLAATLLFLTAGQSQPSTSARYIRQTDK